VSAQGEMILSHENETLVREIQKSFLNLLDENLPKSLIEKTKQDKVIKILSICCGRFREAKSIFDYFQAQFKNKLKLYGIDNDEELLKLAKEEEVIKNNRDFVFLKLADASAIENYKEWFKDGLFDLVIVRHPEITFNTEVFVKIFSICPILLTGSGYLFVTTHFENEKEVLKLLLQLNKFNLMVDIENKQSPMFKVKGEDRFFDKFLLLATNPV